MTFLTALRSSSNAKMISAAEIDTLKWKDPSFYNEPYVHYYHAHPAYQNHPVVNISYEGAHLFCIAKGGSWKDISENLKVTARFSYNGNPQPFVGFRYVAEIIEK